MDQQSNQFKFFSILSLVLALMMAASSVQAQEIVDTVKDMAETAIAETTDKINSMVENPLGEAKGSGKADMPAQQMSEAEAQAMQRWQEYSTPGEAHEVLGKMVGTWDVEVESWMTPDAPVQKSQGKSEVKWILGERFVAQEYRGEMMGQPFEGLGFTGYNNMEQEYTSIWMDNMGTGVMSGTGLYDSETNSIAEKGTHTCPMTQEGQRKHWSITTFVDDNTHTYEMFSLDPSSGEKYRNMIITYTRSSN